MALDGRIIGWNAAAERLYGYSAGEMIGTPASRIAPVNGRDDLAMALDRHLQGLPAAPFEAVRHARGGRSVAVTIQLAPLRSPGGRLVAIAAIHRASAAAEHDPLEGAAVGVHTIDPVGTVRWANRTLLDRLGYRPEEFIGQPIAAFAADLESLQASIGRSEGSEPVRTFDLRLRAKDGEVRHLLVTAGPCREPGGSIRYVSIDITARNQAVQGIEESERQLRVLVQGAPVLLWVSGASAKMTYFNQPWLDFTGRPIEATIGDGWIADVHPDDLSPLVERLLAAFQAREPFRAEHRLRRRDGAFRWMLSVGRPVVGAGGEFGGFLGATVEIESLRHAAEEREQAAARDARIDGVLLAAREMSHLLNNSIAGAIGSLELLAANPGHERYQALIPGALTGLESAARHLRELQNIVRVETKQTPVGESLDLQRSTG